MAQVRIISQMICKKGQSELCTHNVIFKWGWKAKCLCEQGVLVCQQAPTVCVPKTVERAEGCGKSRSLCSPQRNSSNLAAAYCSQMGTYAWWCQNFCYFKRRQCGCLRVWKLLIFQGWQRTRIFKEHLSVPDPAYQCETRALDGRVLNALSLCNPSVLICTQTMWAPRREITSKSMAHIKSLWLLSSKFLFGEYLKKACQINNENNHMAVIQIFPKCEMYPIH